MKKLLLLYSVPPLIQIFLLPFWFLNLDARYIDASIVGMFISFLSPIYLIVINILKKYYAAYGLIRIHLSMVFVICLTEFFHYLGWSKFNIERFFYPDPMTVGLSTGLVKMGIYTIIVSFIVLLVVRLKRRKT